MKIWGYVANVIHKINQGIFYISLAFLLLMIVFVAVDVAGRYVFGKPVLGDLELQEYMMVVIVFLGLGACTRDKQHVYIEILVQNFKGRALAITFGTVYLISAIFIGFIVWQMAKYGLTELTSKVGGVSQILGIPRAPFILLAALGLLSMALEFFIETIVQFKQATNVATIKKEVVQNG